METEGRFKDLLQELTAEFCRLSTSNRQLGAENERLCGLLNDAKEAPSQSLKKAWNGEVIDNVEVESVESTTDNTGDVTPNGSPDSFLSTVPAPPSNTDARVLGRRSARVQPHDADGAKPIKRRSVRGSESSPKKNFSRSKTLTVSRALKQSGFDQQNQSRWVINPEMSQFINIWQVVVLVVLCIVAVLAPVQVAILPPPTKPDALSIFNCLIDLVLLGDMVLQFFLMYPRKTSMGIKWEHRMSKIACNYLTSWFIIDVVSMIPFDLVGLLSDSEAMGQAKAIKLIRLLRLLKLARIFRSLQVFKQFELRMSITYGNLALLKYFFFLLIIAHWLANLWALSLTLVDENGQEERWIDSFTEREKANGIVDFSVNSPWKIYVSSFYFTTYTITSVGYGDIGPKNVVETIVAIIMIVVSGVSWAILLGQVCGVVASLGEEEAEFRSMMDGLNSMMQDRSLPQCMRLRLRSFFLASKQAQRRNRQQRLITSLSPGLQGEVVMMVNQPWMGQVRIIKQIMDVAQGTDRSSTYVMSCLVDISLKLQTMSFSQSEAIGNAHNMYIVTRGLLQGVTGRVLKTGAVWGDDFLLQDSSLALPYESVTLTYVELTFLSRQDFMDVVSMHNAREPTLGEMVRYHCRWLAFQRAMLKEAKRRKAKIYGNTPSQLC